MPKSLQLYEDSYKEKNHFSFGKNWQSFLDTLNDEKKTEAKKSLLDFLGSNFQISGKTVVDIGSGSGLFSWAFYELGVTRLESVDIDDFSLACTKELKKQEGNPGNWNVHKISALNEERLKSLGTFDLVYSWGVLHHTGAMWQAITNTIPLVTQDGYFYIALYNKNEKAWLEGTSKFWEKAKVFYNQLPSVGKKICDRIYAVYLCLGLLFHGRNPRKYVRGYTSVRGMDFMTDIRDWLGGHPYEHASVKEVEDFFQKNGFKMINIKEVRSIGCNEFLFKRV
jgi:2-polyprenyl-6-hydroxyphenyl methylase/3-demethylubiquinone-9 3-methyltransferase